MFALLKLVPTPIILFLLLIVVSILLLRGLRKQPRLRIGWYLLVVGTSILFFLSIYPVSNSLVYSLESQYQSPPKEAIATLDVIVILVGGILPPGGFRKSTEASGVIYSRLFNGVEIFKQSSAKILVLSSCGEKQGSESNAEVMKNLDVKLGVSADRIITEPKSRNTMEHAIELAKLFLSTENRRIGIVTSALHIPRAVQVFRKKFSRDIIIPIPVGYIYSPQKYNFKSIIPSVDAFVKSSYAIHEWIGIV